MSDICDMIDGVSSRRLMTLRDDLDYTALQKLLCDR